MEAIFGIISAMVGMIAMWFNKVENDKANTAQMAHDKEMAEIELENQKKLMQYQNNLTQDTNMIATQKGQMASAGYSPALMYGGNSMPIANVSGGSASASAGKINPLQLFDRLPVDSAVSSVFTARSQQMQRERLDSDIARNRAAQELDMMKAAHEYYDTRVAKRLQNTIVDKAMYELESEKEKARNTAFMTRRGELLLPGELVSQGLVNNETARKIEKIQSDMQVNTWAMSEIRANINRLNKLNEVSEVERRQIVESVKQSQLGRVMSEFGLTARITPPQLRDKGKLFTILNDKQMKGAYLALRELGFSNEEATSAVLYYTATDPKDVNPTIINTAGRIYSSIAKVAMSAAL